MLLRKGYENMNVKRGELYYADLSDGVGSEQSGIRPVIIIQNDYGNRYSTTTIVSPLTSSKKKRMPTHILIHSRDELKGNSIALLEQMRTIDKVRLIKKIGELTPEEMKKINKCIKISLNV